MKRLSYATDPVLTSKFTIEGVDGSPFYLNEFWALIAFVSDAKFGYFSADDTI